MYKLMATPFEALPRPIYLMSIFILSALTHTLLYYPINRTLNFYPYLYFFSINGFGCLAERYYRQLTGKRVEGGIGRIWVWVIILVAAQPWVEQDLSSGWAGAMRDVLASEPEKSIVIWATGKLGWGPTAGETEKLIGPAPKNWFRSIGQ
jgi:hypothetical protein